MTPCTPYPEDFSSVRTPAAGIVVDIIDQEMMVRTNRSAVVMLFTGQQGEVKSRVWYDQGRDGQYSVEIVARERD